MENAGMFTFDRVFDWTTTQHDIFDYAAAATLEGNNSMFGIINTIIDYS